MVRATEIVPAGLWAAPAPILQGQAVLAAGDRGEAVRHLQQKLRAYGYGLESTGEYDEDTGFAVAAFQRHFRPALVDGRADRSTVETLDALLETLPAA